MRLMTVELQPALSIWGKWQQTEKAAFRHAKLEGFMVVLFRRLRTQSGEWRMKPHDP